MSASAIMILVAWAVGILLTIGGWYGMHAGTDTDNILWYVMGWLPGIAGLALAAIGTILYLILGSSSWVGGFAIASYVASVSMVSYVGVMSAWSWVASRFF